jgi:hypothetical protein
MASVGSRIATPNAACFEARLNRTRRLTGVRAA